MHKKYIVRLTSEEREPLEGLVKKGRIAVPKMKHAQMLLRVDAEGSNWTDERVAEALGCHAQTVQSVRQRFVEEGLEAALERKPQARPSRARILDGEKEARLIALGCSPPPEGHSRWTLKLLADRLVALDFVEAISYETVRRTLKKTSCNPIGGSVG